MSVPDIDDPIAAWIARLRVHPLYEAVDTLPALRIFMERHVVCVWDFMSLVKSLHRDIVGWTFYDGRELTIPGMFLPLLARIDIAAQRDRPGRAQGAEPLPDGGLRRTSRPAGTI